MQQNAGNVLLHEKNKLLGELNMPSKYWQGSYRTQSIQVANGLHIVIKCHSTKAYNFSHQTIKP